MEARAQMEQDVRPSGSPAPAGHPAERFRWWVVLLGAALIPVNSLWIARAEALDYSGFPTCMSLFYNVVFTIMALIVLNAGVRAVLPRAALGRQELLVVYGMVATGSSLVGHDCMQMVVPNIPHLAYFSNAGNNWESLIRPHVPEWLTIGTLDDVVRNYEQGHSTLYRWEHIRPWLVPIGAWSVYLCATVGATLFGTLLLRRHWVESERLTYPIVQIPVMVTEGGGSNRVLRSRLFWGGFSLAAAIDLLNGLAYLFPSLPSLPVKVTDLSPFFAPYPPWNAMGWTPLSFYPFAIGLSFFMPTNLAFSSWFFYLFRKGQQVLTAAWGYNQGEAWYPYLREQSFGAWIALFVAALWFSRSYLASVWRAALTDRRAGDGGVSYRVALAGFVLSMATMTGFLVVAGMTWWVGIVYVTLFLLFCGAAARVRAELGPPAHEIGWVGVSHMMITALGTAALGPKNLAIFSLLHFQNRMHRGLLAPQQAESLKGASESGLRMRVMVVALGLAGVVGVASAFWALLHLAYARTYASIHPGAPGSAFANEAYNTLASWLSTPVQRNQAGVLAMAIGALAAVALARLSVTIHGFPFHPAGYALGMSFGLDYIWVPIFISWVLKSITLRVWGLKGYRAALPFFVGLVIGEFTVGGAWSFVRGVLGVQTYTFYIW